MIDFPCSTCGRAFSVPDDEAGRDMQCPSCGILLAIPLPSDLVNLNADGTLRMTVSARHVEPDRLAKLQKAFGKMGSDGSGGGFDASAPPELIEIAPLPEPRKPPPRYDPETGERVVELAVAKKAPVAAIPVRTPRAQMGTVSYATPGLTDWMSSTSLWLRLFQPANMMVMAFVFGALLIGFALDMFISFLSAGMEKLGVPHIPSWIFNILFWLACAHYANVVEETGPGEQDDLPRPLRHMIFVDDIYHPLIRLLLAFVLTYTPAILVEQASSAPGLRLAALMLLMLGGFLFPAVLLTTAAGGTLANLRPDRVMNIIRQSGAAYLLPAGLAMVVVPVYLQTLARIDLISPLLGELKAREYFETYVSRTWFGLALGMAGVYAMHGICWRMGQIFREKGASFGWAWEQHEANRQAIRIQREVERQRRLAEKSAPAATQPIP